MFGKTDEVKKCNETATYMSHQISFSTQYRDEENTPVE